MGTSSISSEDATPKEFDLLDQPKSEEYRDYSDLLDKWNGLEHNPDYVNPNFGDFIPGYYRISAEFQVGNSKVRSSSTTMYDTGANVCVMNRREFDKINKASGYSLHLNQFKKVEIEQADGSLAKGYIGTTKIWTTVFDSNGSPSKAINMEFRVFETMGSHDVIIGKNFVEEAGIDKILEYPKTSRIEFGSGSQGMKVDQYFGLMCWFVIIGVIVFRSRSNSDDYSTDRFSNHRGTYNQRGYNPRVVTTAEKRLETKKYSNRIYTLGDVAADEFERSKCNRCKRSSCKKRLSH